MIFFPKHYLSWKDLSAFENKGTKSIDGGIVFGERSLIASTKAKHIDYTKGKKYQMDATMANRVMYGKTLRGRSLCFPGYHPTNWYHNVADMGFQIFFARKYDLADRVLLPVMMKNRGKAVMELFRSFGMPIKFVHHPWLGIKTQQAIFFDRFTGRLSEAITEGQNTENVLEYFSYLKALFESSEYCRKHGKSEYGEKIFSTRRGNDSRIYEHVTEVEQEYIQQGYQIVYFGDMGFYEQMSVMANATHFVGFHGANLTNLIFAHQCQYLEELITRELSGDFEVIARFKNMQHSRRKLLS